jgi:hypothetical protein
MVIDDRFEDNCEEASMLSSRIEDCELLELTLDCRLFVDVEDARS